MSLLKTQDYAYDLPGPGQDGDDLDDRAELVRKIAQELEWCLQWHRIFGERTPCRIVLWSHESITRRLLGMRRMQTHRLATAMLYPLPVRQGVHHFALSYGGTLYRQRALRLPNGNKELVWFNIDDLFATRLSNGVLSGYLLWSLRHRDGHVELPQGVL